MSSLRPILFASLAFGATSLLAVSSAMSAGPKRTYDPYGYNSPASSTFTWTGFYVGAHIENGRSSWDNTVDTLTGTTEDFSVSGNKWMVGAHTGYQHQWGPVVLGAEFSYSPLNASASFDSVQTAGLSVSSRASDLYMFTGKLGYAMGRTLGYLRGGWARTNFGASTDGLLVSSASNRSTGWVSGVGLDYAVTDNLIIGAEYNSVRFNGQDYAFTDGTTTANITSSGMDVQSVKLRLDFKFN